MKNFLPFVWYNRFYYYLWFMDAQANTLITDLLALSLKAVRSRDLKARQLAKMKAGKIRKQLNAQKQY